MSNYSEDKQANSMLGDTHQPPPSSALSQEFLGLPGQAFPLALGSGLVKPVAGRRLATVTTVLRYPIFQRLDPGSQHSSRPVKQGMTASFP